MGSAGVSSYLTVPASTGVRRYTTSGTSRCKAWPRRKAAISSPWALVSASTR